MSDDRMSVAQFKKRYRESSGWPNVQDAIDDRKAQAETPAKRGPGRPPKSEVDAEA